MQKLTKKQESVLEFVEGFHKTHGFWPDIYDIIEGTKASGTLQAMQSTIRTLEGRSLIERSWGTRGGRKRLILSLP